MPGERLVLGRVFRKSQTVLSGLQMEAPVSPSALEGDFPAMMLTEISEGEGVRRRWFNIVVLKDKMCLRLFEQKSIPIKPHKTGNG